MAYIQYTNGARELRSEAEAEKLWLIKIGRARPQTPLHRAQVSYIRKMVKRVRLNFRSAPEEYIWANLQEVVEQAVASWIVDRRGRPCKPANKEDMDFAIKYGLWRGGGPTSLVTGEEVGRQVALL